MDDIGVADQQEAPAAAAAALDPDDVRPSRKKVADRDLVHAERPQQFGEVAGKIRLGTGDAGVPDRRLQGRESGRFIDGIGRPVARVCGAHAPILRPRSSGSAGSASACMLLVRGIERIAADRQIGDLAGGAAGAAHQPAIAEESQASCSCHCGASSTWVPTIGGGPQGGNAVPDFRGRGYGQLLPRFVYHG